MSRSSLLLLAGLCTFKALGLPPLPRAPYFPQLAAAILKSLSIRAEQGPPFLAARGGNRPVF